MCEYADEREQDDSRDGSFPAVQFVDAVGVVAAYQARRVQVIGGQYHISEDEHCFEEDDGI